MSAEFGDMDLIRFWESRGVDLPSLGLAWGARCKDKTRAMEVITYFVEKGGKYSFFALYSAAKAGPLELVKHCETKCLKIYEDIDWNRVLDIAIRGKHEDIVKYCIAKGADRELVNHFRQKYSTAP
jgi:hypothetical protein